MDDILGFVIFLVIIAISIISKIRKEAKESQERPVRRERHISKEDIPEATRRMLYGDGGGIQVAKPRTAASEHRPHTSKPAHPVAARQLEMGPEHRVAPPKPPRPPQPVRQMGPQSSVRDIKREIPTMVHRQPPTPQPMARQYNPPKRYQPRPHPQPVRRRVVQREQEAPRRQYTPKKRMPKKQPVVMHTPASGMGLAGLLASKNEIARGILLREILGPPKAFEDFG